MIESEKDRRERKRSPFYRKVFVSKHQKLPSVLLFMSRSGVTMAKSTSNSNKDERPANERRRISEDKAATDKNKGMDVPDYARHEKRFVHSLYALWAGYIHLQNLP